MRKLLVPLMAAGLLLGQMSASRAITFAQFIQAGAAPGFQLIGGTAGTGHLSNMGSNVPIVFQFKQFAAGSLLNTNIDAVLTLDATASDNGRPSGSNAQQDFHLVTWHLTAINSARNTALGIAAGANLLSGTSGLTTNNGGTLSGAQGGSSATFGGSDVTTGSPLFFNAVAFTSDFMNFGNASDKAYAYSFSAVNPMFFLDGTFPDFFLRSFNAAGTGTFSFTPGTGAVPEPGALAMFVGMGISGGLLGLTRRRRRV